MTRRLVLLLSLMGFVLAGTLAFPRDAAAPIHLPPGGGLPQLSVRVEEGFRDVQQALEGIDSKFSHIIPLDFGLGTTLATDYLQFTSDEFRFEFGTCAILNVGTTPLNVRIALWAPRQFGGGMQVLGVIDHQIAPNDLREDNDFAFREGGCAASPLRRCWCTFTFDGPANTVRAHFEKFASREGSPTTSVAREVAR